MQSQLSHYVTIHSYIYAYNNDIIIELVGAPFSFNDIDSFLAALQFMIAILLISTAVQLVQVAFSFK